MMSSSRRNMNLPHHSLFPRLWQGGRAWRIKIRRPAGEEPCDKSVPRPLPGGYASFLAGLAAGLASTLAGAGLASPEGLLSVAAALLSPAGVESFLAPAL